MKNRIIYLLLLIPAYMLTSCEKDIEVFNSPEVNSLNFIFEEREDTLISHTFIYTPEDQLTDTIWMEVETIGFVTDYPRSFTLCELAVDSNAAVSGKHYIAFDDSSMKDYYVIAAKQNKARFPLILKKEDPELANKEFNLKIGIKPNENFQAGLPSYQQRLVKVSNILTKPKDWNTYAIYYFAGEYGKEKHHFMIATGNKIGVKIDEEFFHDLVGGDPGAIDMGLTDYWRQVFKTALAEENALRASQGQGPLREAPEAGETEGKLISFDRPM